MDKGKVLLGVAAGLAAGAALGLLLATDKGSNTRKKIGKKKDMLINDMKVKLNGLVDDATHKLGFAADKSVEKSKNIIDNSKSNIKESMS